MSQADRKKEFELFSRRFIRELKSCETLAEWGELIAANGKHLGECSQQHPTEYVTIKVAIREHSERIERQCLATTSSASTDKETAEPTPSTLTAIDQP